MYSPVPISKLETLALALVCVVGVLCAVVWAVWQMLRYPLPVIGDDSEPPMQNPGVKYFH